MRCLSLFSGIGAHDLGLQMAGVTIAGQVELDPYCYAVLEKHWPDVPRWNDVRTVTGADVFRRCGRIDLITGGFPCQNISAAGKGDGLHGDRSSLFFEIARLAEEIRPTWLLLENVPALRSRGADRVLAELDGLGYARWPCVVGAWAVGAPHKRDRVWIVGRRVGDAESGGVERVRYTDELPEPRMGLARTGAASLDLSNLPGCGVAGEGDAGRRELGEGQPVDAAAGGAGELADAAELREGRRGEPRTGADAAGSGGASRDAGGDSGADTQGPAASLYRCQHGLGYEFDCYACYCAEIGLADPAQRGQRADGGAWGGRGHADQQGADMAQSKRTGLAPEQIRAGAEPTDRSAQPSLVLRWPARPGEEQHEWEAPRLVYANGHVGRGQHEQGRGSEGRDAAAGTSGRPTEPGVGDATARASRRLAGFARRNALKALGNANPPHVPYLIGRWMIEQEGEDS